MAGAIKACQQRILSEEFEFLRQYAEISKLQKFRQLTGSERVGACVCACGGVGEREETEHPEREKERDISSDPGSESVRVGESVRSYFGCEMMQADI